ncbi:class I SAM-dependent methyltransferase [Rugamonas sp. CCM 8940]|uniref:class I SAM-dependent methyltransferase n=1 Tax=Rugamonas sp. CCM 8940 TaxID=2765359 RepID=UPI0018F746C5|nr:class I SAM-dependent methyltransferase [Rugamonas sp. CCM 8940]MBJ7313851.1 class I SAM-dependent methyltransferase [Rugamonas sp. CCM 8940]
MRWPRLARLWRAPAVRALLLQALALLPAFLLLSLLARLGHTVTPLLAALTQGACAAALGWCAGLAVWWRPIQLLFPLALLGASAWHLPPAWFLSVFLFLLGLYWSTFRTQVPYYPSNPAVWAAVQQLLPAGPARMVDIGSGLGGLVLHLARRRADVDCVGIELAPLPWLLSRLRAALAGSRARFLRGDYEELDFAQFDLVFAYLSPAVMGQLWRKAAAEMRPGSLLLSYEFAIVGRPPDKTIHATAGGAALYGWYF